MALVFSFASLAELVTVLQGAGLRAETEAKRLNPPGVLIRPTRLETDTFGSTRVVGNLLLIVPDVDPAAALESLSDLLTDVAAVYPVSTAALRTVLMPDGAPLPGLEVPFTIRVDKNGDPL